MLIFENSGKTINDWCEEAECSVERFKYWRYKARIQECYGGADQVCENRTWIKTSYDGNGDGGVSICIGSAVIKIGAEFDRQLLRNVVEALS
jgi:hypothetical protein